MRFCTLFLGILMAAAPLAAQSSVIVKEVPEPVEARRYVVDCDRVGLFGLQRTLDRRTDGVALIVEFSGTCEGTLKIRRDDVILRGRNAGATIRGQVQTLGASRVELRGFTVRDTPTSDAIFDRSGDGIQIEASQLVEIRDMQVIDAGSRGISVQNGSSAYLIDSTVTSSGGIGVVAAASTITMRGHVVVSDGGDNGLCVINAGSFFVDVGAVVESLRNQIGVVLKSQGAITVTDTATLSSRENVFHGVFNATQGSLTLADAFLETRDNGQWGIANVGESHLESLLGTAGAVLSSGNGAGGIAVLRGANVALSRGTVISENSGFGVAADEGTLWFNGGVVVGDNDVDVALLFGSRMTVFGDNELGDPPFCDGTQYTRGGECAPNGSSARIADPAAAWEEALKTLLALEP